MSQISFEIQTAITKEVLRALKEAGVPTGERKQLAQKIGQGIVCDFFEETETFYLKDKCVECAKKVLEEPGCSLTSDDVDSNPHKILEKEIALLEQKRAAYAESIGRTCGALVKKQQRKDIESSASLVEAEAKAIFGDSFSVKGAMLPDVEETKDEFDELKDLYEAVDGSVQLYEEMKKLRLSASKALETETTLMQLKKAVNSGS